MASPRFATLFDLLVAYKTARFATRKPHSEMYFPVLFLLPALVNAFYVTDAVEEDARLLAAYDVPLNTALRNHTVNEFVKVYVRLLKTLINTKTPKAYQDHNAYIDLEMLFSECYSPQYQNYKMYRKWLEQFVLHHSDAKIKVVSVRGGNDACNMRLHLDVRTLLGPRLEFDMEVSADNDKNGWSILFVNRNIGCG